LKESLLSRRESDDDASTSRSFVHRLIAKDKGEPFSPFDRPIPIKPHDPAVHESEVEP